MCNKEQGFYQSEVKTENYYINMVSVTEKEYSQMITHLSNNDLSYSLTINNTPQQKDYSLLIIGGI